MSGKALMMLGAVVISSCSRSTELPSEDTPEESRCTLETPGSSEAVDVARCWNGLDGPVVGLESKVDEQGRASQWTMWFKEGEAIYVGGIYPRVKPSSIIKDGGQLDCGSEPLVLIDSAMVVRDAQNRFRSHDPDPDGDELIRLIIFGQYLPCVDWFSRRENRVTIWRYPPGSRSSEIQLWDFYYDDEGQFVKFCGPCSNIGGVAGDPDCTPCYQE